MAGQNLETITGQLSTILLHMKLSSIPDADEIINEDLGKLNKVLVKNMAIYTIKRKKPILYITRKQDNYLFKNIKDANRIIRGQHNISKEADIGKIINAESTLNVNLSNVNLDAHSTKAYLEISENMYGRINGGDKELVEGVFGKRYHHILRQSGIGQIRINTLSPRYILNNVKPGSAIVRACKLTKFNYRHGIHNQGDVTYFFDATIRNLVKGTVHGIRDYRPMSCR